jgi:ketosteroid isomerase-like protein
MSSRWGAILGIAVVAIGLVLLMTSRRRPTATNDGDLAAFNEAFRDVILRMDNAGVIALWAEDGVSLLPDTAPIVGKKNIAEFLEKVVAGLSGYRVTKEETEWRDARISGDWASEWGIVHQEVMPPGDKPPIEVYGHIALVLHREPSGWKIEQEMWQSGP